MLFLGMYSGGCSSENAWNERGYILPRGLRDIDWRMQILYMYNQTQLETVKKCHDLFNVPKEGSSTVSSPFCAASYGSFSRGAGNTEICLRRSIPWTRAVDEIFGKTDSFCSYLYGVNLIAFLPPKIYKNSSSARTTRYLMLAVRQDSFGLIPEISPGEISVLTSVIAILAAARGIGLHASAFKKAAEHSDRHVIIAFFDGESFEYIGSSDVEFTMGLGIFPQKIRNNSTAWIEPIEVSQLDGIVEIQQLGTGNGKTLNGLVDGRQFQGGQLKDLLDSLSGGITAAGGSLVYPTADSSMPPSSWYPFARVNPSIKGVVLAPFKDKYEYRRVNSMLDRAGWTAEQHSIAISEITLAASAVLRAAADYVRLDPSVRNSLTIDRKFVSDLTDCFIVAQRWANCSFFAKMEFDEEARKLHLGKSTYVSTEKANTLRSFIEYGLVYAIGSTADTSNITDEESCAEFAMNQNDVSERLRSRTYFRRGAFRRESRWFLVSAVVYLKREYIWEMREGKECERVRSS
ncbi:cation diffusion facilitator family transporter [Ancylostoma caninum]|uniref:Nicastrin n=1 Tax=Ancylostoma caninum TaxID=29170 RepID=A0A368FTH7_ANCCA|nr:cation diffusion facilitator family transporter [Ancylostoma caninum]